VVGKEFGGGLQRRLLSIGYVNWLASRQNAFSRLYILCQYDWHGVSGICLSGGRCLIVVRRPGPSNQPRAHQSYRFFAAGHKARRVIRVDQFNPSHETNTRCVSVYVRLFTQTTASCRPKNAVMDPTFVIGPGA